MHLFIVFGIALIVAMITVVIKAQKKKSSNEK